MDRDIAVGVAGRASIAQSGAMGPLIMNPMFGALQRLVTGGMTVHAARMGQHLSEFSEDRLRALCAIGNALERGGGLKPRRCGRLCDCGREADGENSRKKSRYRPHLSSFRRRKELRRAGIGSAAVQ